MADDILVTYKGNDIGSFVAAFDAIHLFLYVLGARIALRNPSSFPVISILGSGWPNKRGPTWAPL